MPFIKEKCYVLIQLFLIFLRLAKLWPWMAYYAPEEEKNIGPKCLFNLYSVHPFFASEKVCL